MNQPAKELHDDPGWLTELASFLEQNRNVERLKEVKAVFVQTYFDNIHDGMTPRDALDNARTIALCYLAA